MEAQREEVVTVTLTLSSSESDWLISAMRNPIKVYGQVEGEESTIDNEHRTNLYLALTSPKVLHPNISYPLGVRCG